MVAFWRTFCAIALPASTKLVIFPKDIFHFSPGSRYCCQNNFASLALQLDLTSKMLSACSIAFRFGDAKARQVRALSARNRTVLLHMAGTGCWILCLIDTFPDGVRRGIYLGIPCA